jgi:hypothetical protein
MDEQDDGLDDGDENPGDAAIHAVDGWTACPRTE